MIHDKYLDRPGTVSGEHGEKKTTEIGINSIYGKSAYLPYSIFFHIIGIRPVTTAEKGRKIACGDHITSGIITRSKKQNVIRGQGFNPPIPYYIIMARGRRLLTAGKIRSNTIASHTKPQNVPFETGLDREFLDLFAKD